MSIVERALEKSRAAVGSDPALPSRRAGDSDEEGPRRRRIQQATNIDEATRIRALAVSVDAARCRERRVLLGDVSGADTAAVAAYRMLRTRLLQRTRNKSWSTVAVTSAGPNDGKTLTAINLALSIAREKGREVVLLDMDMRNPSICPVLGIHPPSELRQYLEHGGRMDQLFFSVGPDNLLIAGSSSPTEHASELLGSPRCDEFLRSVRKGTVDPIILIDLPPVLLTDDALVMAPKVDAVLVVASEGVTSRAELAKVFNVLSEFTIAGLILNRATRSKMGYDYAYNAYDGKGSSDR